MAKQADEDTNKPWMIRDVPEETRRDVKAYAAKQGMTVAEALTVLVAFGLEKTKTLNIVSPPMDLTNSGDIDRLIQLLEDLKTNPDKYARKDEDGS